MAICRQHLKPCMDMPKTCCIDASDRYTLCASIGSCASIAMNLTCYHNHHVMLKAGGARELSTLAVYTKIRFAKLQTGLQQANICTLTQRQTGTSCRFMHAQQGMREDQIYKSLRYICFVLVQTRLQQPKTRILTQRQTCLSCGFMCKAHDGKVEILALSSCSSPLPPRCFT